MGRKAEKLPPSRARIGHPLGLAGRSCIPENGQSRDSAVKERFVRLHKMVLENGLSQVVDRAA